MRHAGPDVLARIAPLLADLRALGVLREPRPGVFQRKSRAFLHFHDDPAGIFADVRLGAREFVRMRVTTRAEQVELLDRIEACLGVAARHGERSGVRRGRARERE